MIRRSRWLASLPYLLVAACADDPALPTSPEGLDPAGSTAPPAVVVADPRSLQQALDAPVRGAGERLIRLGADLVLDAPLTYSGAEPLRIDGGGALLVGPQGGHALVVTGGADLALRDVTIEGAGGHGVYVELPGSATGTADVELHGVTLRDNGLAGLWVDDQIHASAAGVSVVIRESVVRGNGFREGITSADHDGIRVNEGGAGDLDFVAHGSVFSGNAADGVELDETGPGDARARLQRSRFDDNGDQPQNPADLEDGFDIDEAGAGDIRVLLTDVSASGNEDEGIDLDEDGTGGIGASLTRVRALDNMDANVSFTEDEAGLAGGSIEFDFARVTASDSRDGDGVNVEEFGGGDVRGRVVDSHMDRNGDEGVQVEQNDGGSGELRLLHTSLLDNADGPLNTHRVEVAQVGRR